MLSADFVANARGGTTIVGVRSGPAIGRSDVIFIMYEVPTVKLKPYTQTDCVEWCRLQLSAPYKELENFVGILVDWVRGPRWWRKAKLSRRLVGRDSVGHNARLSQQEPDTFLARHLQLFTRLIESIHQLTAIITVVVHNAKKCRS